MRIWVTILVFALVLLLAIKRGGEPERTVAAIFALAFVSDIASRMLRGPTTFLQFDPVLFCIELSVWIVVMTVAIRANRWWPICVSALQVIIIATHLSELLGVHGVAGIYWAMTTVPTYLQWGILLLGICFHANRTGKLGPYRDWRLPVLAPLSVRTFADGYEPVR